MMYPTKAHHLRPREFRKGYTNDAGDVTLVSGFWVPINPDRIPSKADGRTGTRRAWKRAHAPGALWLKLYGDWPTAKSLRIPLMSPGAEIHMVHS